MAGEVRSHVRNDLIVDVIQTDFSSTTTLVRGHSGVRIVQVVLPIARLVSFESVSDRQN
jgi:hypothetical protein